MPVIGNYRGTTVSEQVKAAKCVVTVIFKTGQASTYHAQSRPSPHTAATEARTFST